MGGVCESAAPKVRHSAHSACHDRCAKNLGWIFRDVRERDVYRCFRTKKNKQTKKWAFQFVVVTFSTVYQSAITETPWGKSRYSCWFCALHSTGRYLWCRNSEYTRSWPDNRRANATLPCPCFVIQVSVPEMCTTLRARRYLCNPWQCSRTCTRALAADLRGLGQRGGVTR